MYTYVCIYIHPFISIYLYIHVYMCIEIHPLCVTPEPLELADVAAQFLQTHMYENIYKHIYIHTYTQIYACTCMHLYI